MFNALVLGFVVSLVVGLALGPLVIKKTERVSCQTGRTGRRSGKS